MLRKFINGLGNIFMKPLLKTPLHFLISGSVMLVTFTGRKSGKTYSTPVAYRRVGNVVMFTTQKQRVWWKNLPGAEVHLQLKGKAVTGKAECISDPPEQVAAALRQAYPNLSEKHVADWTPISVVVRIHLPE